MANQHSKPMTNQHSKTMTNQHSKPMTNQHSKTMTNQHSKPMTNQHSKTMTNQHSKTMTNQHSKPMTNQHSKTMTNQHSKTMTNQHSKTMTNQHNKTMTNQHSKTMTNQHSKTMTNQHNKTMTNQHSKPMTNQHSKTMTNQHSKPMTNQHSKPMTNQHSKTMTNQHSKPMTNQHSKTMTNQHSKPMTNQHSKTMTNQHSKTMTNQHSKPMTNQHSKTMTNQHSKTMTNQHSKTMTNQHNKTMTNQHSKPMTNQHSKTMTNQHSKPMTNQHSKPMTNQHSKTMTNQHSKTMTNQHSKLMTNQHSKTMTNQHSKTMTNQHGKTMTNQHSKTMTNQHSKPMTNQHNKTMTNQHSKPMTNQHSKTMTNQHSKTMTNQHSKPMTNQHTLNFNTATVQNDPKDGQFLGQINDDVRFGEDSYTIASFLGIPFAEPPVGDRRFSKPKLVGQQNGTVNATSFKRACYQKLDAHNVCQCCRDMSDDCLYLNIYVPVNIRSPTVTTSTAATTPSPPTTTTTNNKPAPVGKAEHFRKRRDGIIGAQSSNASSSRITPAPKESAASTSAPKESAASTSANSESSESQSARSTTTTATFSPTTPTKPEPTVVTLTPPRNLTDLLRSQNLSVLIYIHGGSYYKGSGSCYDGSVLAGYGNIIVVTINYRLGPFGFLSTEDDVISGNLALWDQLTAIQWVNRYIHSFGGDNRRITVGGQSAGSYSSLLQAMYAPNDGLFKRVIAQSGTPLAKGSINTVGYETALALARSLGCDIKGDKKRSQEIKSCLQGRNSSVIANAVPTQLAPSVLPLEPSLDHDFIKSDPRSSLLNGSMAHFARKDLLMGTIAQDGEVAFRLWAFLQGNKFNSDSVLTDYLRNPVTRTVFEHVVFEYFAEDLKEDIDSYKLAIETVVDRYVNWENPTNQTSLSNRLIALLTDVIFLLPSIDTVVGHSLPRVGNTSGNVSGSSSIHADQGSTYLYRFSLPHSVRKFHSVSMPWFEGTAHSWEVNYVFGVRLQTPDDVELSKFVMNAWSNFIKTGNPNGDDNLSTNQNHSVQWLPFTPSNQRYMNLSYTRKMESSDYSGTQHFWHELVPLIQQQLRASYQAGADSVQPRTCPSTKGNTAVRRGADVMIVLTLNSAFILNFILRFKMM
ncbi:hypothetical protein Btru_001475 [Bulinus truncatus]|nr:hypothetical protein Btru_001475 [Bulinus truncatus]